MHREVDENDDMRKLSQGNSEERWSQNPPSLPPVVLPSFAVLEIGTGFGVRMYGYYCYYDSFIRTLQVREMRRRDR